MINIIIGKTEKRRKYLGDEGSATQDGFATASAMITPARTASARKFSRPYWVPAAPCVSPIWKLDQGTRITGTRSTPSDRFCSRNETKGWKRAGTSCEGTENDAGDRTEPDAAMTGDAATTESTGALAKRLPRVDEVGCDRGDEAEDVIVDEVTTGASRVGVPGRGSGLRAVNNSLVSPIAGVESGTKPAAEPSTGVGGTEQSTDARALRRPGCSIQSASSSGSLRINGVASSSEAVSSSSDADSSESSSGDSSSDANVSESSSDIESSSVTESSSESSAPGSTTSGSV